MTPEAYLAKLAPDQRATLEKVRAAIRAAAPDAEEGMSYGMPCFTQGKVIAGYAASTKHCSYHPMSGTVVSTLAQELSGYETSKGTIRFPVGKPLPKPLIRKLVKARLAEIGPARAPRRADTTKEKPAARPSKRAAQPADSSNDPARIDAFLAQKHHPLESDIQRIRQVVLSVAPGISEEIKWNSISFRNPHDFFATVNLRSTDSVQLILYTGVKRKSTAETGVQVADPQGLIQKWPAKDRCIISLGTAAAVRKNESALRAFLKAWLPFVT